MLKNVFLKAFNFTWDVLLTVQATGDCLYYNMSFKLNVIYNFKQNSLVFITFHYGTVLPYGNEP